MADNNAKIVISAVDNTKSAINSVKSGLGQIEGVGNTLNGVIGRLAPLLGAATFTAFVKGGIDTLDMLGDLSDRTGVAASTLSGFQLVAAQSDTSLEALGKGLNKLSVFMAENGKAAAKLGVTSKDPTEAFIQLSEVLSNIENIGQRNAVANKFLGKSYQELLPSLLQGGDALRAQIEAGKELVGVTDDNVKKAQEFNDKLDLLKTKASNAGVGIGTDLLPSLNEITTNFIENNKKAGLFLATLAAIGNTVKIATVGTDQENLEERQLDLLDKIQNAEKRNAETSRQSNKAAIENQRRNLINLRRELADVTAQLEANFAKDNPTKPKSNASVADTEGFLESDSNKKSRTIEIAKEAVTEYAKLYGEFTKIIDGTNELSRAEQALVDIQSGKFADLLPWQQEQLAGLANQVRAMQDLKVFEASDLLALETQIELQNDQFDLETKMQQQRELAVDAYDKVLESIALENEELEFQLSIQGLSKKAQNEKIAARNVEVALQKTLNELADQGLGLSEEEIIALREKYGEIQRLNTKLDETKNISKDIGLTFGSALEDAIVEGRELSEVIRGIGQDIIRMLARRTITEPLKESVDGILKSFDFGSIFRGLTPNADGGVYSGSGISAYSGSVVSSPTVFPFAKGVGLMGEAGPEAILPLRRTPNGKLGVESTGSLAPVMYNVEININGNGTGEVKGNLSSASEIGRQIDAAVRKVLLKEKMNGGILS